MKLSIITINYNNCEGLRKTIDSVINQTWQDFEWIIVDGGSTDGSRELIVQTAVQFEAQGWKTEQFSGPEDPVAYIADHPLSEQQDTPHTSLHTPHCLRWCSEKDKGIYNAMNKGIVHAQGEYCLFLNSGDCLYEVHVLEKVMMKGLFAELECYDQIFENSEPVEYACRISGDSFNTLFMLKYSLPHQSTLIRRNLLIKLGGYDENLKIVSDWKFFLQAVVFEDALCHYTDLFFASVQPEGVSIINEELRIQERQRVLAELFPHRILSDYSKVESLSEVLGASSICRVLYSLLYRLALIMK